MKDLLIAIFFFLFGLIALIPLISEEMSIITIEENGIEVKGKVVRKEYVSTGYGEVWEYNVEYVDEKLDTFNISNVLNVGREKYDEGDFLLVLYDKNKHENGVLKDDLKDPFRVLFFLFYVGLILMSFFYFYRFRKKRINKF